MKNYDRDDNDIGPRLRKFRKSCTGCATQKEFAEVLRIDQQRLSGYENGTRIPHHVLASFVRMGANPYWLLFGEGSMRGSAAVTENIRDQPVTAIGVGDVDTGERQLAEFYILPLYADEDALRHPRTQRDTEIEGPAVIHRVLCPHPEDTDHVRVHSTGHLMEPTIPAGSTVTVDRSERDPERLVGKVVALALREGRVALRRLQRNSRGGFVGVCDNPAAAEATALVLQDGDAIAGMVQTVHTRLG